jgi:MFS transporter, MHS family, shikimate and dehydroshikimate transport protein
MKIPAGLASSAQTISIGRAVSAEYLRMSDSSDATTAEHNPDIEASHRGTEGSAEEVDTRTLIVLAGAATAGVLLEFYDFTIFGYAAASAFPHIFFPNLPPARALVFSYLAYGSGYPARLIGAFLFGHFGDRTGRKIAFLMNILIVGASTCVTGLLPGYSRLGLAAPVLLVCLRVVQGIGIGGEFGGASSLLAEFAAKRRCRAFWTSLASLGIALGLMAGSAIFLVLRNTFATSGWRVAMLLSALIAIPALVARYKLTESPLFGQLRRREQLSRLPTFDVFRKHAFSIAVLAMVTAFQIMDATVTGTYFISFMSFAGIPLATTATIIFLSRIADVFGVCLSGPLADLFKRKVLGYFAIGLTTFLSYPFALAVLRKQIMIVMILQCVIVLLGMGALRGLIPILTSESFPTKFRYSGSGISFGLGGVLGGMTAPPLLASLIGQDILHKWYYVPVVYAVYCSAAILGLLFLQETRNLRLEDLDIPETDSIPRSARAVG